MPPTNAAYMEMVTYISGLLLTGAEMDEREWMTSDNPQAMLKLLFGSESMDSGDRVIATRPSDRKLRLIACACARQVWYSLVDDRSRLAVEVAERFADGEATAAERESAYKGCFHNDDISQRCVQHVTMLSMIFHSVQYPVSQANIIRDIIGNPFHPIERGIMYRSPLWNANDDIHASIASVAKATYNSRLTDGTIDPVRLFILADALEDAGCTDNAILDHFRGERCPYCKDADFSTGDYGEPMMGGKEPYASRAKAYWMSKCVCKGTRRLSSGPHYRGCHVLDCLLGKS